MELALPSNPAKIRHRNPNRRRLGPEDAGGLGRGEWELGICFSLSSVSRCVLAFGVFWQELCATVAARCAALTFFAFCHGGMFSHGDSFHIPRFLAWDAKPGFRGLASLAPFYRVSVENRFLYSGGVYV